MLLKRSAFFFFLFFTLSQASAQSFRFKRDAALLSLVDSSLQRAAHNYSWLMKQLPEGRFPVTYYDSSQELRTSGSEPWVGGFYPGALLYLYEATGDTVLYNEALRKLGEMEKEQYNKTTHDLGFMMYCSFGNAFRLYPGKEWKDVIVTSARSLATRFNKKVGCIKSWDSDPGRFMVIIDNMMNLELLFAATRLTGDSSFYKIAVSHANTTMRNHFRADYSSHHLVIYDPKTGGILKKQTVQGASDSSAWSRGQSWGLYGYTMTYRETRDKKYLDQAIGIADFMLRHLPEDAVFYWDFDAPGIPHAPRDVSAAAVTCSALLELQGYVKGKKRKKYLRAAESILRSLSSPQYFSGEKENDGFILKHGTGNFPRHADIDVPLIYADYYYVEALMRYRGFIGTETDAILNRYKKWIQALKQPAPLEKYIATYDPVRQWSDIDYTDLQPAGWKVALHLQRVRDLALAWTDPSSKYFHNAAAWKVITGGLDHWLQKRYKSSNWWHNMIGVPQMMRDIVILLRDVLPQETTFQALEVVAQFGKWHHHTGANLVWSADIALHYAALTGDMHLLKTCSDYLVKEIHIGRGEGIQPDYSFQQHGPRLMIYQYGNAFLRDNIRLAWQLRGTQWAYPVEKIKLLCDFILQGWQWMARGIHTVPGTMDRSISRANTLRTADIRELVPYLLELDPSYALKFRDLAKWQNGNYTLLNGFRYYPFSDFAVYHTKDFSFFLKTISTRTLATESINNENLKGKLLNSGDAYLIRNGNEYYNLAPDWNWERLPGVTAFAGAEKIFRKPWVGSVSDGNSGASTMDYALQGKNGACVAAKKSWFCHDGQVVCLIAGLQQDNTGEVYTALDQCRWQGDITVNTEEKLTSTRHFDLLQWVHHAGLGYIFLQPSSVTIHADTVTNSWQSINASASALPITEKIFTPVFIHHASAAGYVLTAAKNPADVAAIARDPSWQVLRNDSLCQAVSWKDGTVLAVFHSAGTVNHITVDKPCMVLIKGKTIAASNPLFEEDTVTVTIDNQSTVLHLPANGATSGPL
jgi:chondroitin AC lyase